MDELENALAWFKAAPANFYNGTKDKLAGVAQWIWEVLQGDFNDDPTTAQVITGTVISMIPLVDQICDVRDVVANCKKINEDTSNTWAWVGLILTLIGLFPTLGSLAKGCLKILFAYGRKSVFQLRKSALDSGFWSASRPFVESGISKLNEYLQRPAVRRALRSLRWHNPYRELARLLRELAGSLNVSALLAKFDIIISALRGFVDKIKRWGSDSLGREAEALLEGVNNIRRIADSPLRRALGPVTDWLLKLARRLEVEADMAYRASTNAVNPHHYRGVRNDAEELTKFTGGTPRWVDEGENLKHEPMEFAPAQAGWPDISDNVPSTKNASNPLAGAFRTFHSAKAVTIPEGETLYRIVDPGSSDNSICWMRKAEFDKLKNKDDWRRHFAVKANWNANGEYVTYTVPKGGLKAWEGPAASQAYKDANSVVTHTLEGGYSQIVLDPKQLDKGHLGSRRPTGWGYTSFGESVSMVGVPTLKNNWYGK
ncbi:hypothetical protein CO611_09115 [Lysobacteraceae bacterium NML03-0222]|nr:hypothetical protein CO611_09115 [Xanthomonadaceae bacterium NML03-0222]